MKNHKVFLFCSGVDDVFNGLPNVAGIQVQMSFWARTFVNNGWKVLSFSNVNSNKSINGVEFVSKFSLACFSKLRLELVSDIINSWRSVFAFNPDVVIARGASRNLYFLSILCKWKKIKLIYFGASDSDFMPGKEIIGGNSLNRRLYQKSIRRIQYFVSQNIAQNEGLLQHYNKNSLILPNIWIPKSILSSVKQYDAIWIANLRPLKRAEWFVELAKSMPNHRFVIVGGVSQKDYYEEIEHLALSISNLSFLGAQPFEVVNMILSESKLLVCTSEYEGFPNTFLQAWAQSIPIVSTVNPSSLLTKNNLGIVIEDLKSLKVTVDLLLNNEEKYKDIVKNIQSYFLDNHSADCAFNKLIDYIH